MSILFYMLFSLSFLLLAYCYAIYPLLLSLVAPESPEEPQQDPISQNPPRVAILLSVYNEAPRLQAKIDNFRSLDYPSGQLELWIGSDGGCPGCRELVEAAGDDRIHLVEGGQRAGKTAVLNRLAGETEAELLLFTDVNSMLRPGAVRRLAAAFADPTVGLASGRTVAAGAVEGAYYRLETWLKRREGSMGCLPGADGAIYMLRRRIFEPLPADVINDLAHPLMAAIRGFRAVMISGAICDESETGQPGSEFQRQTRMSSQAFYVYLRYIGRMLAAGRLRFAWVLTSHKLLRWGGLLWLAGMLAGAAGMAMESWLGVAALAGQALLWVPAAVAAAIPAVRNTQIGGIAFYFVLVHLAYLRGVVHSLQGKRYVTWEPRAG